MSVNANHYVMLGNKWRYDEFYDLVMKKNGWFEPMTRDDLLSNWRNEVEEDYLDSPYRGITNHNGVTIISDGMDGEYVCIGYVIAKSGEYNDLNDYTAQWHSTWDDIGDNIVRACGFAKDIEIIAITHYR